MKSVTFQDTGSEFRLKLEEFMKVLHRQPKDEDLQKTPDGKAAHLPISFIEMTLDELFFGMWSTENFRWSALQNEIQGSIDLVILHPFAGFTLTRTGAASIQIMVDAVPDEIKSNKQLRNSWSIDVNNKKPNALDMGFPKLKAECIKNAAMSLGKAFGRDINRTHADTYRPLISGSTNSMRKVVIEAINDGKIDSAKLLIESSRIPDEMKIELLNMIPVKELA